MTVLQHNQGIGGNEVIKGDIIYEYPTMVEHRIELLQPNCHGLDGTGPASKEEQSIQNCRCVIIGFIILVFFINKQVLFF